MAVGRKMHEDAADLASRLAALLPERATPPLIVALVLLRLGVRPRSRLLAAVTSKLKAAASSLPHETSSRMEAELLAWREAPSRTLPQSVSSVPTRSTFSAAQEAVHPPHCDAQATLPLSCCAALWQETRQFYATRGSSAFTSHVPSHVSTSAFLANAYAAVISSAVAESEAGADTADSEPVYILDLGCGCGVLGVRVALELQRRAAPDRSRFCVVLADLEPTAALAQAAAPSAASLVRDGLLDVAKLDLGADIPHLHLLLSGRTLHPGELRRPLVVLASYLLDSLPLDILRVRRTRASSPSDADNPLPCKRRAPAVDETTEALTPVVHRSRRGASRTRFAYRPLPVEDHRIGSEGGRRLRELCERLLAIASADAAASEHGCAAAVIPSGAARCLWALFDWLAGSASQSHPTMLLLVGDKIIDRHTASRLAGARRDDVSPVDLAQLPLFDIHGGAGGPASSCLVLDGIIEALHLCADVEGTAPGLAPVLHILGRTPAMMEFDVCAFALAQSSSGDFRATRREFEQVLGTFGPAEMERLYAFVQEEARADTAGPRVSLDLLVDVIRLGAYDWELFVHLRWMALVRLRDAAPESAARAVETACRCFDERITLDANEWMASEVLFSRWLYAAGEWMRALRTLRPERTSSSSSGPDVGPAGDEHVDAERAFLEGLCRLRLRQSNEAERLLREAECLGHRGAARRVRRLLLSTG